MANDHYEPGQPLTPAGIFQLVADEAFKDGDISERDRKLLKSVAHYLKLDKATAKDVLARSREKVQSGELGRSRPLDSVLLYERVLYFALADGQVDVLEERFLGTLRRALKISDEEHQTSLQNVQQPEYAHHSGVEKRPSTRAVRFVSATTAVSVPPLADGEPDASNTTSCASSAPNSEQPPPKQGRGWRWLVGLTLISAAVIGIGLCGLEPNAAECKLEGRPTVQLGFKRARVTYKTSLPCPTECLLVSEGNRQTLKNARDGDTLQHTVEIPQAYTLRNAGVFIALPGGLESKPTSLGVPGKRLLSHFQVQQEKGETLVGFTTEIPMTAVLTATFSGKPISQNMDPTLTHTHTARLPVAEAGKLKDFRIELTDILSDKCSLKAGPLALDSIAHSFHDPIEAIAANQLSEMLETNRPTFGPADLERQLKELKLDIAINDLARVTPWIWQTTDVSLTARTVLYDDLNRCELEIASIAGVGADFSIMKPISASTHARGHWLDPSKLSQTFPNLFAPALDSASKVLAAISRAAPTGRYSSGAVCIDFDPKYRPQSLTASAPIVFQLPGAPPSEFGTATLICGIKPPPSSGLLTVTLGKGREIVFFNTSGSAPGSGGEDFVARVLDARLLQGSPTTVTLSLRGTANGTPRNLEILGLFVIYQP
jgi:hypothetical protein